MPCSEPNRACNFSASRLSRPLFFFVCETLMFFQFAIEPPRERACLGASGGGAGRTSLAVLDGLGWFLASEVPVVMALSRTDPSDIFQTSVRPKPQSTDSAPVETTVRAVLLGCPSRREIHLQRHAHLSGTKHRVPGNWRCGESQQASRTPTAFGPLTEPYRNRTECSCLKKNLV